jgi:hypothetical protein
VFLADRRGQDRGIREQHKGGEGQCRAGRLAQLAARTQVCADYIKPALPACTHPRAACKKLRRPPQSAELVLDVAQLVLDMLPPLEDYAARGQEGISAERFRAQRAGRLSESTVEGSMRHILAGVGVGVWKRSGLTGAPAVNFLSGFSAARRSMLDQTLEGAETSV